MNAIMEDVPLRDGRSVTNKSSLRWNCQYGLSLQRFSLTTDNLSRRTTTNLHHRLPHLIQNRIHLAKGHVPHCIQPKIFHIKTLSPNRSPLSSYYHHTVLSRPITIHFFRTHSKILLLPKHTDDFQDESTTTT